MGKGKDADTVAMETNGLLTTTKHHSTTHDWVVLVMQMSLLDIAVKRSGETPNFTAADKRTLIFVGTKSSGKTTIIQRFLEKNEPVKETLALEYCFARKSGRSLSKDVCHIWELGGGTLFSNLLPTALGTNVTECTLIVVVDLSRPGTLWITLETLLQIAYNHLRKFPQLDDATKTRFPADHPDSDVITAFPMPLILIGGKHDVFLNMDPEDRKLVTRTLRLAAHTLAASLLYYSDHDSVLGKKLKDLLNHHGFGGPSWKGLSVDINKAVTVPYGCDSYEQISAHRPHSRPSAGLNLDFFKHDFIAHFPQETEVAVIPDDPAKDSNFREPAIDQLRAHKDEELDRFLQEIENKEKLLKTK